MPGSVETTEPENTILKLLTKVSKLSGQKKNKNKK
jgi:hypothetical protein